MKFIADNFFWMLTALVSGGLLVWPTLRTRLGGPALTTLQVTQLINQKNAQVVDVRDAAEFAKGSLPGAKNLPLAQTADPGKELKKDKPIVVVDDRGAQAPRAASQLRAAGFDQVFVLAGGLTAWREAGLPLRA